MDSITLAIMVGLSAEALPNASKTDNISDGYAQLRLILIHNFGASSGIVKALKDLETNPTSNAYREALSKEVAAAKPENNPELLRVAQELLETIKSNRVGGQIIQKAISDHNIQISGDGNIVRVHRRLPGDSSTDAPPPEKK